MAETPAAVFEEWRKLYAIEPWGDDRNEILHGNLCTLVDAMHRTRGQVKPPIDYMPHLREHKRKRQTEGQMKQLIGLAVKMLGGKHEQG